MTAFFIASCGAGKDEATAANEEYAKRYNALYTQWKEEKSKVFLDVSECRTSVKEAINRLSDRREFFLDRYIYVDFSPERVRSMAEASGCKD